MTCGKVNYLNKYSEKKQDFSCFFCIFMPFVYNLETKYVEKVNRFSEYIKKYMYIYVQM